MVERVSDRLRERTVSRLEEIKQAEASVPKSVVKYEPPVGRRVSVKLRERAIAKLEEIKKSEVQPIEKEKPVVKVSSDAMPLEHYQNLLHKSMIDWRDTERAIAQEYKTGLGIDPTLTYSYIDPKTGKKTHALGSTILDLYVEPAYEEAKKVLSQAQLAYVESLGYPKGTTVKRVDAGYELVYPDMQLEWAESEMKKGEQLPTGFKELYLFGYGTTSTLANLLKPVYSAFASRPSMVGGKTLIQPQIYTRNSHFLTPLDVALEPVGLAPKGSTELIGRGGPSFWAGGLIAEAGIMWGASKLLKPVGAGFKIVGGKIVRTPTAQKLIGGLSKSFDDVSSTISQLSPSYQRLFHYPVKQFIFQSPKRYGLKGAMVSFGRASHPEIIGQLGVGTSKTGGRLGLGRMFGFRKITDYTRPLLGLPKRLESGRWIYGTKTMWMHAEGPSYQALLKGVTRGGLGLGYDPFGRQMALTSGEFSISEPYGLFGRKVKLVQEISGRGYGYVSDDLSKVLAKSYSNVFKTGEPMSLWQPYSFQGTGKYLSKAPSMGELVYGRGGQVSFTTVGGLKTTGAYLFKSPEFLWIPKKGIGPWMLGGVGKLGKAVTGASGHIPGIVTGVSKLGIQRDLSRVYGQGMIQMPGFASMMGASSKTGVGSLDASLNRAFQDVFDVDFKTRQVFSSAQAVASAQDYTGVMSQKFDQLSRSMVGSSGFAIPPFMLLNLNIFGRGRRGLDEAFWKEHYKLRKAAVFDPLKNMFKTNLFGTTKKSIKSDMSKMFSNDLFSTGKKKAPRASNKTIMKQLWGM